VLDRTRADREPMAVVRRLHSLSYFGPVANGVVEVLATPPAMVTTAGAVGPAGSR
jgi:uncharacterized iron-regulated membrane protein